MNYRFENARCVEVIDGDTVEVEIDVGFYMKTIQRFRLYRINAPETRTKDKEEKIMGINSKEYLTHMITGKNIIIETHKTGKFGRWLAEIYLGKINLNDEMVREGYAVFKDYDG